MGRYISYKRSEAKIMKYYSIVDLDDADFNPICKKVWEAFEKKYGDKMAEAIM